MERSKILYSNKWVYYYTKIDDEFASVRVDLGAKELQEEYKQTICVRIYYTNKLESGMPMEEEYQKLNAIDNELASYIQSNLPNVYQIGAITTNGHMDYIYVSHTAEPFETDINTFLTQNIKHKFFVQSFLDEKFDFYYNVLFPTEYDFNVIYTRQVCQNIETQGDAFKKVRPIDYFACFKEEKNADNFIKSIKEDYSNYEKSFTELDEWEVSFQNELIPTIKIMLSETAKIFELAKKQEGVFAGWGCTVEK